MAQAAKVVEVSPAGVLACFWHLSSPSRELVLEHLIRKQPVFLSEQFVKRRGRRGRKGDEEALTC